MELAAAQFNIGIDPVNPVGMGVVPVVTEFIHDEQGNQEKTRQPNSQPDDVNEGVNFIFLQIPPGNGQVIFYHDEIVLVMIID